MNGNWPETRAAWARFKAQWAYMTRERRLLKATLLAEKMELLLIKTGDRDLALKAVLLGIEIGGRE